MPRYYFNLVKGDDLVRDFVGLELSENEVISTVSVNLMAEIEAEDPDLLVPWAGWRLQVTDGDGSVITALALDGQDGSAALHRSGSAR
jgi:hypothetical protein